MTAYRMKDGPIFPSIEHLVEYYALHIDGLPTRLTYSISPGQPLIHLIQTSCRMCLLTSCVVFLDGKVKPMLLTPDMEDSYIESASTPKVQCDSPIHLKPTFLAYDQLSLIVSIVFRCSGRQR